MSDNDKKQVKVIIDSGFADVDNEVVIVKGADYVQPEGAVLAVYGDETLLALFHNWTYVLIEDDPDA